MPENRAVYMIPIALLAALVAFLVWRNWATVRGALGTSGGAMPAGASGGGGGGVLGKIKDTLMPAHSFDPRKGSVANPAGYLYKPAKTAVVGVANGVASVWKAVTPW